MKIETPMYVSKVQLVCPKCNKGVRVGYKYVADKKLRVCRKCGKATRVGHKIADGKKVRVCKKCGAEV